MYNVDTRFSKISTLTDRLPRQSQDIISRIISISNVLPSSLARTQIGDMTLFSRKRTLSCWENYLQVPSNNKCLEVQENLYKEEFLSNKQIAKHSKKLDDQQFLQVYEYIRLSLTWGRSHKTFLASQSEGARETVSMIICIALNTVNERPIVHNTYILQ